VTVIDCATDSAIATLTVGAGPVAILYNPLNSKAYCVNYNARNVSIIRCVTNSVMATIPVGNAPQILTHNPVQNRVYVPNYGSASISVIRDSMTGIEEGHKPQAQSRKPAATVIRSLPQGAVAFEAMGRRARDPKPGVHFVQEEPQATSLELQAVRKVVVTR